MFNAGLDSLLAALPSLSDLDEARVRQLLGGAWFDIVDERDLGGPVASARAGQLRRLATALEVEILLHDQLAGDRRRACAFVGAEALSIAREANPERARSHGREVLEEALLYLIAGYDANAALTLGGAAMPAPTAPPDQPDTDIATWAIEQITTLVDGDRRITDIEGAATPADGSPTDRVRHELWRRIGDAARQHVLWLRMHRADDPAAPDQLQVLIDALEQGDQPASHPDLHHLMLLRAAIEETHSRALRRVPGPADDGGRFSSYLAARAATKPLLWPAAAEYVATALPGPSTSAVVAVPTGAGKSSVAELAIAQAIQRGWVLYLAPTRALVSQVRRDLAAALGATTHIDVLGFVGGAEYTTAAGEALDGVRGTQVLVMTPEKCTLALRQEPESFAQLSLCVLDEAHLLGDQDARGVVCELVLAETMHRAPDAKLLLLSALVADPAQLASWIESATGQPAVAINPPWRPTRTLRALAGLDADVARRRAAVAHGELRQRGNRTRAARAPVRLLGALHGRWTGDEPANYAIADTHLEIQITVQANGRIKDTGFTSPMTRALTQALAEHGHRVLTFLPADPHAPFSYARDLPGVVDESDQPRAEIDALLALADAEIVGVNGGEATAVRGALAKGFAIHTGAMLPVEQRASELAFDRGLARVMLATGTLAQGLNLPATAVVVAGTIVGDRRTANTTEGRRRSAAQLLNAIGRAGRAQVAARAIAIVVPDKTLLIEPAPDIPRSRSTAEFLEEPDATIQINSPLESTIVRALDGTLNMTSMTETEQAAFALLSFTAGDDATAVLARSHAALRAGAAERADTVAAALGATGLEFLRAAAPDWVTVVAHRAATTLPVAAELHRIVGSWLRSQLVPNRITEWAHWLLQALKAMPPQVAGAALPAERFRSTPIAVLHDRGDVGAEGSWTALTQATLSWLRGDPLTQVGAALQGQTDPIATSRNSGSPLPRTLRVIRSVYEFDLAICAGAIVALITTGSEQDPDGPWILPPESARSLALLPLAIRDGAGDPEAIALLRAGVRPRAIAHFLSARLTAPQTVDDDELRRWARSIAHQLGEDELTSAVAQTSDEARLLACAAYVRML